MNKKLIFISLTLLIPFLFSGCSEQTSMTRVTKLSSLANQPKKNNFDQFMPGLYHNIIILKFINPVPIRILEVSGRGSMPAAINVKRFVYMPGERTKNDIKQMNELKINDILIKDELTKIENILTKTPGIKFSRYFSRSGHALKDERLLVERLANGDAPDLNNYYNIFVGDTSVADAILHSLNESKIVEVAYFAPIPLEAADIPPPTPNYYANQRYLDPAPNGINAQAAWALPGGNGSNVKIIDIEGDWALNHEDMAQPFFVDNRPLIVAAGNALMPEESLSGRNHGTAVIGIISAQNDGLGTTGIANGSNYGVVSVIRESLPEIDPSLFYRMTADAINVAAANLNAGDVILIEQHAPFLPANTAFTCSNDPQCGYVAVENWKAEYDAIFSATALGVIVIEPAGNGSMNLDSDLYSGRFDPKVRDDSGAIIVGASTVDNNLITNHTAAPWSNYGSRVNVHAWGENIWTLGYGDGARINGNDERQWYTNDFGGTSGASAIVAGAVAAIQGARKAAGNTPLGPVDMRQLLIKTGTPQSGSNHIGPQPDLASALSNLVSNPIPNYTCSLPADHSDQCGGAACVRKTERVCWDDCFLFFCEHECLIKLNDKYECVNR